MNDTDCFLINEFENKLVISLAESKKSETSKFKSIHVSSEPKLNEFIVKTEENVALDAIFEEFFKNLSLINLNDKQMDNVLKLSETLIGNYSSVLNDSLKSHCTFSLSEQTKFFCNKFHERNSKLKRIKCLENNPLFVPAEKNTIGVKWKCKIDSTKEIPNHFLEQNEFSYASIIETIKSMFKRPKFKEVYLSYNLSNKHKCTDGTFFDYCCGANAKNCPLFDDPKTIQIDVFADDFEVTSGLKTKTVIHNVTGVYFRIRNLPAEYNSRLDNIHLTALVKVQDLKQSDVSFDNVMKKIVSEIQELQTIGIQLDCGMRIMGTMISLIADNLGANGMFGLIKCFNTDGFCRICECAKVQSEKMTLESPELMRSQEKYLDYVEIAKVSENRKESKGIDQYCLFNDLDYFHIFKNYSIDIMHDMNEGVLRVFMKLFFDTLIARKVLSGNDIVRKVRDHVYGLLNQRNKPSKLMLIKNNLNQNASQSYTLFTHLPFIFNNEIDKISDIWSLMEMLSKIVQIVFSTKITDRDLTRLNCLIPTFLHGLIGNNVSLTPKLHNMIHYVTVIRNMGPLIHMWAMRMEAKHRVFTKIANNMNCFKNITETLSTRHQQHACLKDDMFVDKVIVSQRKTKLSDSPHFDAYKGSNILDECFEQCDTYDFLKVNALDYRKGFVLFHDESVFEITEILYVNKEFFFICCHLKVNEFNENLNSIEISSTNEYKLVKLAGNWPIPHEKKILKNKKFIIANTLDVFNDFP